MIENRLPLTVKKQLTGKWRIQEIREIFVTLVLVRSRRGVARICQRGGHHPGIADYIWFIPLLSLVYQRAQSYYRGIKAHIN